MAQVRSLHLHSPPFAFGSKPSTRAPQRPNAARFCQHIHDHIACASNAQNGAFEASQGENQDFPAVYTVNGAVLTYTQPPEALGVITTLPYQPRVPASSNCVPFESAALAMVTPSGSAVPSASGSSAAGSRSSSLCTGTGTGSAQNANQTAGNGNGGVVVVSGVVSLIGVISALFLS
ncbi:hypothetical protein CCMSSC00406_0008834 [Pleurotus cornucopiae]|uniref:Uncharacterized protein n=1 Tax=Pleurotus cornucopiae TaxID=5321 RepID=A0ACB7IIL3_PLECO|nr:hypothetical protein CCMSSC00406_0008834 [Pleurotus cornucopiae]